MCVAAHQARLLCLYRACSCRETGPVTWRRALTGAGGGGRLSTGCASALHFRQPGTGERWLHRAHRIFVASNAKNWSRILAVGSLTHAQLAEKYGRHPQAIAQFSVRNKAEIAVIQAGHNKALHERLATIPIADQARRIAVNGLLRDDLLDQLEDPNLDLSHRNRLTKTAMALNRAVAEEMGDLRTKLDLAVQKNVLNDYTEFVIDDDGTFHPLAGSNVDGPTPEASE
jgi:hypothetical protein